MRCPLMPLELESSGALHNVCYIFVPILITKWNFSCFVPLKSERVNIQKSTLLRVQQEVRFLYF